jgi:hypothetical protein
MSWTKFAKLYTLVRQLQNLMVGPWKKNLVDFHWKGDLRVQMIKFPLTLCNKSHKCSYSSPLDYWCKALSISSCYSQPRTTRHALYIRCILSVPFILNTHFTLIKDFLDDKSKRFYLSCVCQCSFHIPLLYTIFYIWKLL